VFAELLGPLIATYFLLNKDIDEAYIDERIRQIMRLAD